MGSTPETGNHEYAPGGFVPDGPVLVERHSVGPIIRVTTNAAEVADCLADVRAAVDAFTGHMAAQDPERLEQDRAQAWGSDHDPTRHSPDAMVVTYDRTTE